MNDPTIPAPSLEEASQVLTSAAEGAKALGDNRVEAYAWGSLGRLNEIATEYPTAEKYTRQALNLISSYDASDIAYQYFWQLGRVEKAQNDLPKAIASYTKAYNALQSLRTHKNATPNSYFLALYLSFKNLEEVIRDRFR